MASSRAAEDRVLCAEDLVRVPMNRLDPEKLLELLVTSSKAIYQKPKYLRCGELALRSEERGRSDTANLSHFGKT